MGAPEVWRVDVSKSLSLGKSSLPSSIISMLSERVEPLPALVSPPPSPMDVWDEVDVLVVPPTPTVPGCMLGIVSCCGLHARCCLYDGCGLHTGCDLHARCCLHTGCDLHAGCCFYAGCCLYALRRHRGSRCRQGHHGSSQDLHPRRYIDRERGKHRHHMTCYGHASKVMSTDSSYSRWESGSVIHMHHAVNHLNRSEASSSRKICPGNVVGSELRCVKVKTHHPSFIHHSVPRNESRE